MLDLQDLGELVLRLQCTEFPSCLNERLIKFDEVPSHPKCPEGHRYHPAFNIQVDESAVHESWLRECQKVREALTGGPPATFVEKLLAETFVAGVYEKFDFENYFHLEISYFFFQSDNRSSYLPIIRKIVSKLSQEVLASNSIIFAIDLGNVLSDEGDDFTEYSPEQFLTDVAELTEEKWPIAHQGTLNYALLHDAGVSPQVKVDYLSQLFVGGRHSEFDKVVRIAQLFHDFKVKARKGEIEDSEKFAWYYLLETREGTEVLERKPAASRYVKPDGSAVRHIVVPVPEGDRAPWRESGKGGIHRWHRL